MIWLKEKKKEKIARGSGESENNRFQERARVKDRQKKNYERVERK